MPNAIEAVVRSVPGCYADLRFRAGWLSGGCKKISPPYNPFGTARLCPGNCIGLPETLSWRRGAILSEVALIGGLIGGMIVMMPLFLRETMKLSNRYAGPLFRLKISSRSLASGKPLYPWLVANHCG